VRKRIARVLRRLAGAVGGPPEYSWPLPDPQIVALEKQTEAIRSLSTTLKDQVAHGMPQAVNSVAIALVGPQIVRAVNDTRAAGVPDTEILTTLVERLSDGWW
jgi:hypothetical protein